VKNRFKVEMRGNQPVVYDTKLFQVVRWFKDVLHDRLARKKAETEAARLNQTIP
jgi:hypothetical protein